MVRALETVIAEEDDPSFREVLIELASGVKRGRMLSEALEAHGEVFSPSVRELIRTAEKTGAWDDILQEIADGLADGTFG